MHPHIVVDAVTSGTAPVTVPHVLSGVDVERRRAFYPVVVEWTLAPQFLVLPSQLARIQVLYRVCLGTGNVGGGDVTGAGVRE